MSNKQSTFWSTVTMVQLGILAAIILVMNLTPLGFLKVGPLSISFLMLPVAIGGIICGPFGGAILGMLFGILSFSQCLGSDAFGTTLFGINPFATFIMCVVSRMLAGFLSGLIFKAIAKFDKTKVLSFSVSTLSAALLNTFFFIGSLILFFGKTEYIIGLMDGASLGKFIVGFVGLNGVVEAIVCCIVGAAISKALAVFIPSNKAKFDTNETNIY